MGCDNILPLSTNSGKNIFGCKIDGQALKTKKNFNILKDFPISAGNFVDSTFYVSGTDYNDDLYVELNLRNLSKKGKYKLDNFNTGFFRSSGYSRKRYTTNSKYTGNINITRFDTKNKIISGTFEFEAVNRNDSTDVVKVTRGRFDVNINKL